MLQLRIKGTDRTAPVGKRTVVGGHELCQLQVTDPAAWPTHCIVSSKGNVGLVMALDPKAVLRVNGETTDRRALKPGDELAIGAVVIVVEQVADPPAALDAPATPGAGPEAALGTKWQAPGARPPPPPKAKRFDELLFGGNHDLPFSVETMRDMQAAPEPAPAPAPAAKAKPRPPGAPVTRRLPVAPPPRPPTREVEIEMPPGVQAADEPAEAAKPVAPRATPGPNTSTRRLSIVSEGGKIDVEASLRQNTRRISASELAATRDTVRVLSGQLIKELIQAAVEETTERLGAQLDAKERERLLHEAEEEFQLRLKGFQAEKEGLETQTRTLQLQLTRAQKTLEEERTKVVSADQFTMSKAGVDDLEQRFERLVRGASKGGALDPKLSGELEKMVAHLLDSEREKIAEQARQAQGAALALLQKKVARLASSLEQTEKERDKQTRRAQALEASGGAVAGAPSVDAGVKDDDPDKERKMSLLKEIFAQNQAIRQAASGRLPQQKLREGRQAPTAAPAAAPAPAAPEPEPAAAAPEPEPAAVGAGIEASDDAADLEDPDNLPWQPGMSFSKDVAGDDEDPEDDTSVKKMVTYKAIAPPPLERKPAP